LFSINSNYYIPPIPAQISITNSSAALACLLWLCDGLLERDKRSGEGHHPEHIGVLEDQRQGVGYRVVGLAARRPHLLLPSPLPLPLFLPQLELQTLAVEVLLAPPENRLAGKHSRGPDGFVVLASGPQQVVLPLLEQALLLHSPTPTLCLPSSSSRSFRRMASASPSILRARISSSCRSASLLSSRCLTWSLRT
jgi:hypothetical protein